MLDQIVPANIFAAALVFARLGSALMLLPGIGEVYVAPRLRLVLALGITLVATPVVASSLPPLPTGTLSLMLMLGGEIAVGLFLGTIARILLASVEVAGTLVSRSTWASPRRSSSIRCSNSRSPSPARSTAWRAC